MEDNQQTAQNLPTADEAFGAAEKSAGSNDNLPTFDEAMSSQNNNSGKPSAIGITANAIVGSAEDFLGGGEWHENARAQFLENTSLGRILQATGMGISDTLTQPLAGMPGTDTEKALQSAGMLNDYVNGEKSFRKSVIGSLAVPAAAILDAATRFPIQAPYAAIGAAMGQTEEETGIPIQDILNSTMAAGLHIPVPVGLANWARVRILPQPIAEAKSAGVLEPEAVFTGVKEPTPEQSVAMHDAAVQVTPEEPIKQPEPALPDIHQAARNIDPETFAQYDKLSATQDDLRNQLQEMRDTRAQQFAGNEKQLPQVRDEIATLQSNADAIMGGKNEADLSPKNLAKVQDIRSQIDDLNALQDHLNGVDTPEMAAIRQKIQDTNYAMRDLAPDVSAAYRKAQEGIGSDAEIAPQQQAELQAQTKAQPEEQIKSGNEKSVEQQKQLIIADQAQKLIAAGRPEEEANAAAQLVAEHYTARAERFGGKNGTAEEMYNRDMATVKAGREKVREKELAQSGFSDDDTVKFRRDLDAMDKGTLVHRSILRLGNTPDIIGKISGNQGSLVISPSVVKKIEGSKHNISRSVTARLKLLLSDPIAVFDSETEKGDIVAAISIKDKKGKQVIVPIRIGKDGSSNIIKSVYGRTDDAWFQRQIDEGRLRYLNKQKASELPGFSEHNVPGEVTQTLNKSESPQKATQNNNILTEDDFVNKNQQNIDNNDELNQGARGKIRLATDDAKAAITLMKSANASTFIHEAGHHWLDELMHDATDEHAPADLIQDSKTVRDWLGVKDNEEIPTKAHEKFARGFERYLMEGTAPSKQLAGVFAKFKQWLTKIYQTVDKLKSPISDDIRDVFDRLLAKNPEKTVIAPDHEAGKMMADIHETDAEHTAPEHAAEVADNINEERQRLKEQNDVTDTENSAGNAGNAKPSTTGSTATTESGITQQPSPISASGNKTAPEGGQLRAAKPTAEQQRTDPRSGSGEVRGNPKSELVDKAGNIRLDNLNAPESVNEVIRQIASENHDFTEARGVVSDDQVMRLADSLGVKASEIQLKRIASIMGPGQLAAKIMAARKLLIQSATNLRDLMAKAATGTDADVMAYAEAKQRHIMIQSQVSGITAEAGRALRAFRNIEGSKEAQSIGDFLKQATGKDLFQLKEEAKLGAALDTPEKVSKFIEDSKKPSFGDMILEYWVNGLISGPATHTTYAIGNTLLALWKSIPETAVASLLGKLRGDNAIKLGEVGAQLKGAYENLPLAVSAAAKAAKTGLTTLLPNEEMASTQFGGKGIPEQIGNEAVTWKQAGSDAFGAIKGLRDAFIATGDLTQTGAIPDFALGGLKIPVGSIIRAPARAIAAIHSFFRTVNYSMDKAAIAYRTARDEGLEGNDFDARVADIVQNPSEEIMTQARSSATNLTLMGEGGEFTKAISRLTNASVNLPVLGQTKLLKFIDPFVQIGSNVIDQAILQRTPLGLLSEQIRADLSGANGAVARDFAASRMIVGSALAITIGGLAAEGLVSGSGPSDPRESSAWRMLGGNQPHSIKIGDVWYDVHRLGPLGMLMGISADLYDVAHTAEQGDMLKASTSLVHAITQNILDESFMRGPSDLIKALTDSDRYGDAYIRNFVSSFVPFSVGLSQEARAIDPYSRQARTIVDAIKAKIPYVSESLYPRRDVWGQPIANKDVLGAAGFSAIYESRISKDPTNQRLLALGVYPSQPERKIRGVQLTDQQYDDFCKIAGKTAKMRLDSIVPNTGFANLPEAAQIDIIKNTIKTARETASSIVMMQNPDIIKKATEQKLAILQGKK